MSTSSSRYSAKIVKVGNSRGFRVESAFFRSHPEFSNDVTATVVGPGAVLISAKPVGRRSKKDEPNDPVVGAFLSFLEREMAVRPELIAPLDKKLIDEIGNLVKGVERP